MGFTQAPSDPCFCVDSDSEGEIFVEAVYMDDINLGGKSESKLMQVKKELSKTFEMKDLGPLHHFLEVKIIQDSITVTIWIDQQSYTEKILMHF